MTVWHCTLACPAGVDIQGFIALLIMVILNVHYLIRENAFTFDLWSVCPRFCEKECRRSLVDQPLDICI